MHNILLCKICTVYMIYSPHSEFSFSGYVYTNGHVWYGTVVRKKKRTELEEREEHLLHLINLKVFLKNSSQ